MTGRLECYNVLGTENVVDILTKHVLVELLSKHFGATQMEARRSRAETAPEPNSLVSAVMA